MKCLYSPVRSCDVTACCNCYNCKGERRDIQNSQLDLNSFWIWTKLLYKLL